ncbi:hypothetical protein BJY01DRAFT_222080 [Aspergillus pseudoustus]|uniref:Secreted protein n=1 Tax=Aspergillus pseudoustus TaxID=1810923 RepID=A0ABR4J8I7_9EURO
MYTPFLLCPVYIIFHLLRELLSCIPTCVRASLGRYRSPADIFRNRVRSLRINAWPRGLNSTFTLDSELGDEFRFVVSRLRLLDDW